MVLEIAVPRSYKEILQESNYQKMSLIPLGCHWLSSDEGNVFVVAGRGKPEDPRQTSEVRRFGQICVL